MQEISKQSYAELYQVFLIQKDVARKIPTDMLEHIYQNTQGMTYNYNKADIINVISKEAFNVYVFLYIKFCAKEKEKQIFHKLLLENETKYQNELRRKYTPDNIFKNKQLNKNVTDVQNQVQQSSQQQMVIYKESIFKRILNWFKKK